jgi:predicted carbohydrate-binding protein with CBM5 and CBM33 domain
MTRGIFALMLVIVVSLGAALTVAEAKSRHGGVQSPQATGTNCLLISSGTTNCLLVSSGTANTLLVHH